MHIKLQQINVVKPVMYIIIKNTMYTEDSHKHFDMIIYIIHSRTPLTCTQPVGDIMNAPWTVLQQLWKKILKIMKTN